MAQPSLIVSYVVLFHLVGVQETLAIDAYDAIGCLVEGHIYHIRYHAGSAVAVAHALVYVDKGYQLYHHASEVTFGKLVEQVAHLDIHLGKRCKALASYHIALIIDYLACQLQRCKVLTTGATVGLVVVIANVWGGKEATLIDACQ